MPERRLATTDGMQYPDTADRNLETLMGMEPCDVGPMAVLFDDPIEVIGLDNPAHPAFGLKRHHPAGIAPVEDTAPAKAAERLLMDQYRNPADYTAVCRILHAKPPGPTYAAEGETFARLIAGS